MTVGMIGCFFLGVAMEMGTGKGRCEQGELESKFRLINKAVGLLLFQYL